jgi:hypothetical protein
MCESVRKILIIIFENEKQLEIKSAWGRRDVERRGPVSRTNGDVVANVDDVVLLDTRRGPTEFSHYRGMDLPKPSSRNLRI